MALDNGALAGFARSSAFAADRQFLSRRGSGFTSAKDAANPAAPAGPDPTGAAQYHFEVFRADCISVTSTRHEGGDWRWRLSDADGLTLVEARDYRSEALCREAVAVLQARAGRATTS
jgi:uncharacterized protein YegP (UPF0339 family)